MNTYKKKRYKRIYFSLKKKEEANARGGIETCLI